jgi:hypothetical protein
VRNLEKPKLQAKSEGGAERQKTTQEESIPYNISKRIITHIFSLQTKERTIKRRKMNQNYKTKKIHIRIRKITSFY